MKLIKYKLGDLIRQRRQKNDSNDLPICGVTRDGFIPPKQQDADTSLYNVFYLKDFVFNPARMELNAIVFNDRYEKAICSSLYEVFYVNRPEVILPEYLALLVKQDWFTRYCEFMGSGSAREYCRVANISELEIEVPPIEFQAEMTRDNQIIRERIELKRRINDNLVATVTAIYRRMFIEGGRIYPTAPLKQLCSKIGSGATPKGGKTAYQESGVSLIRSTNIFDYAFSYDDLAHISDEQADQLSNVVVEGNDVLFNITGVSVTRCCIVPADVLPARVNQHVMILRPNTAMPMSYYIMTTLCSAENKAKLMGIAQSGSTREAINKQEMESFSIPVPPTKEVQDFEIKARGLYESVIRNTEEIMRLNVMQQLLLSQLSSR